VSWWFNKNLERRFCHVQLIELAPRAGRQQVSLAADKLAELSAKALDNAMTTIHRMAERVSLALEDLAGNPDEVEVEFGIKLDAEGQVFIAKASQTFSQVPTFITNDTNKRISRMLFNQFERHS